MLNFFPSSFLFSSMIFIGITFTLSGDNWFSIWLGFELTLMCFLPIISSNLLASESIIKYFLVQVGGSSIFAISFLTTFHLMSNNIFIISILINLGIFPFHSWVPFIISTLTWGGCLIIVTVQNIGPFFVLCNSPVNNINVLIVLAVVNILISGIIGYNQNFLRPLIAYSSISHTGWITIAFIINFNIFISYLVIYITITCVTFIILSNENINNISTSNINPSNSLLIIILFINLSGLPPFSLFFLNIGIFSIMWENQQFILPILLGSILSIYYYLIFIIPILATIWNKNNTINNKNSLTMFLSFIFPIIWFQ